MSFVELGARMITSFYSIHVHNYNIAVASDPFAWITAGIAGMVITYVIFKKIERRWKSESPAAALGQIPVSARSKAS